MQTRAQAAPIILSLGLAGFVVMADNPIWRLFRHLMSFERVAMA